ncbi:MAG: linear amide C-N hydrolase, partial [Planctomycetaceae bacterium]
MTRLSSVRLLCAAIAVATAAPPSSACTRCMRVFGDGSVLVARSMDWAEDPGSELWVFPRGMTRGGNAGPASLKWTSRYGSVGVSFYGIATVDGMNEK